MIKLFNERALATVAQSVEQLIRNQQVAGSSPASSSKNKQLVFANCLFFSSVLWTDLRVEPFCGSKTLCRTRVGLRYASMQSRQLIIAERGAPPKAQVRPVAPKISSWFLPTAYFFLPFYG